MSNKSASFLAFILGAAVGSVATWQFVKKKYEQIAQEEINSVKEAFFQPATDDVEDESVKEDMPARSEPQDNKPSLTEYTSKLKEHGYTNYSDMKAEKTKEKEADDMPMNPDRPYVIPPEDFGEKDNYEKLSITYYADYVLADDEDIIIDDVEDTVGYDSLNHFGEYEADSVFVRNDRMKCDYEILLDKRNYTDVVKLKPHQLED